MLGVPALTDALIILNKPLKNEIDELKGNINYKHYNVGGPG